MQPDGIPDLIFISPGGRGRGGGEPADAQDQLARDGFRLFLENVPNDANRANSWGGMRTHTRKQLITHGPPSGIPLPPLGARAPHAAFASCCGRGFGLRFPSASTLSSRRREIEPRVLIRVGQSINFNIAARLPVSREGDVLHPAMGARAGSAHRTLFAGPNAPCAAGFTTVSQSEEFEILKDFTLSVHQNPPSLPECLLASGILYLTTFRGF